MATNYGQPPHFDLSKPLFSPVLRIEYGNSVGSTRMKLAIRRYIYRYTNNSFVFLKSNKGVRQNPSRINNVVDSNDVNNRSIEHGFETIESAPPFSNQIFLRSIFAYPNEGGIFFIEGRISKRISIKPEFNWEAPDWFDIYRYGKIINNEIIILKESEGIITKDP